MTNKLKCPFCQQELRNCCAGVIYTCSKPDSCPHEQCYGSKEIWNALIQAKQDLEIARKAFEDIDMLLHSRKFDITELGRLNIIQYLVSRVLKLTEHKE